MNKLHTFLLPIAVGSLGLLWTPLSENNVISYGIIAFAVVIGMFGLHSVVKQQESTRDSQQEILKEMKKIVQGSNEEVASNLQKYIDIFEESSVTTAQEIKQIPTAIVGQIEKTESHLIVNMKDEQTKMRSSIALLEEKIDEGNKILENVSVLMIQELRSILQQTEESVSIQNIMSNELSVLQDTISRNHQEESETLRNIEMYLEKLTAMEDVVQAYLETSSDSHEQVVSKMTDEFMTISANLDSTTSAIINQLMDYNDNVHDHQKIASTMLEKLEQQQAELTLLNEQSATTVNAQLKELSSINKSLVAGISQIADSKSAERQQLLKIQKDLIKKFQIN